MEERASPYREEVQKREADMETQGRRFIAGMAVAFVCYLSSMISLDVEDLEEE